MSNSNHSNLNLLDLFKQEATTHTQYLSDSLLQFEENPSDASKIESLMRAAHSLKGAARIVGLNDFSQLSHLLEDCFVAVQQGKIVFKPVDFDIILNAIDFLSEITHLSDEMISTWPGEQQDRLKSIENDILNIINQDSKSLAPGIQEHPLIQENTKTVIFEVFKNEVLAQIAFIKEKLTALKKQPSASQDFSILLTAALSIKGISIVAQEKEGENIASSLESIFNSLMARTQKLTDELMEKILDLVNQLTQLTASQELKKEATAKKSELPPPIDNNKKSLTQKTISKYDDQFVRISATNLNRLMSLAAESLIETRRLEPLKQGLLQLKVLHRQLANLLDFIQKTPSVLKLDVIGQQATHNLNQYRTVIQNQLELFDTFSRNNSVLSSKLYNEVLASRMRPFAEGVQGFPRLVRNLGRSLEKLILLEISGRETLVDRDILEKLEAPLNHIIRNACDHGIEKPQERLAEGKPEKGTIKIDAHHSKGMLIITLSDDGRGINKEKVKEKIISQNLLPKEIAANLSDNELFDFLFLPGFSTAEIVTDISGRGVGLDVVRNLMQEIGGRIKVESNTGLGTTFCLQLPITRSVLRALSVEIDNQPYAIPLSRIDRILHIKRDSIHTLESRNYFHLDGNNIAIFSSRQVLGFQAATSSNDEFVSLIVLREKENIYSLVIDKILTEIELVIRPIDPRLGKIPCVSSTSITNEGIPILILDVEDLLKYIEKLILGEANIESFGRKARIKKPTKTILVIDDSPTVRETERRLLKNAGYEVEIAVDGVDGWNSLRTRKFNLVITDIDMPRMNGYELIENIKNDSHLKKIPVIIISYKDREEDRLKGMKVGANYYLTKRSFEDQTFINTVKDLIGEPTQ